MAVRRTKGVAPRIKTIIFDLSEVLISGLCGVEQPLSFRLGRQPAEILDFLGGERLLNLCRGEISEEAFLKSAIAEAGWEITVDELKQAIRANFERKVAGMEEMLQQLSPRYELVLLSDHAREWVKYIHELHPHLEIFNRRIYSFETGRNKREPTSFERLLKTIQRRSDECAFVDDSPINIECARKTGILAFRFTDAATLWNDLRKAALAPNHSRIDPIGNSADGVRIVLMKKLTSAQIKKALPSMSDWKKKGSAITRTFQFKDFPAAIKFVSALAKIAEKEWHHPDIDIRWNKVTLTLSTHDAGGLTEKDFKLAKQFNRL